MRVKYQDGGEKELRVAKGAGKHHLQSVWCYTAECRFVVVQYTASTLSISEDVKSTKANVLPQGTFCR